MVGMRPTRLVFVASVHFPVSLNLSYHDDVFLCYNGVPSIAHDLTLRMTGGAIQSNHKRISFSALKKLSFSPVDVATQIP